MLREVYTCNAEGCGNYDFQFKTTQLLIEVVHDGEGGRSRASFLDCWEKTDKAFGNESSPCTLGFVHAQKKISRWKT